MGKSFASIDFETANTYRSSVCSVGIVVVRNSQIVDKFYSLIHPTPNYYSPFNTDIHGLTKADTQSADYFPEVWAKIVPLVTGLPLVAHNSPFDEGCLKAVFQAYHMVYPNYRFYCTCRASRSYFGSLLPNHRLDTVALKCGYDLRNHHNALADAEACAEIALKIIDFPEVGQATYPRH